MKLYIKEGCPHCENIEIPEGFNIETVITSSPDYSGFVPDQVPVLQVKPGFNANGVFFINNMLEALNNAQNGVFKK